MVIKNARNKTIAVIAAMIGALAPVAIPAVARADSTISAVVCQPNTQAAVTITTPQSDSTVSTLPIGVMGSVDASNQIVVYVDGVYDQTVSLAPNQTTYSLAIMTTKGTHAIRLTAYPMCGGAPAEATTIVTVVPAAITVAPSPSVIPPVAGATPKSPSAVSVVYPEVEQETKQPFDAGIGGTDYRTIPITPLSFIKVAWSSRSVQAVVEHAQTAVFVGLFAAMLFWQTVTNIAWLRWLKPHRVAFYLCATLAMLLIFLV